MRDTTDLARLEAFMDALGRRARGPGRVYLTGGSSALLLGIREQTVDIDIKLDPEPQGAFEAIAEIKDRLAVNVELASPDQFLPPLPGWQARSEFIRRSGQIDFYNYDYYSQALSKILRGHEKDLADAKAFVAKGKVERARLLELFAAVMPEMIRYPTINIDQFRRRVEEFVRGFSDADPDR